jgi:hypothetical protein
MWCIRGCSRNPKHFFPSGIIKLVERWTKCTKKGGLRRKLTHFVLLCNFLNIRVLAYRRYLLTELHSLRVR